MDQAALLLGNAVNTSSSRQGYRPDGTKIRKASETLQAMFPVLRKDIDPKFAKGALRIAYTSETLLTLFASLIVIELFVKKPQVIIGVHAVRMVGVLIILVVTCYSVFRGFQAPEVSIGFYFVELTVVLLIMIAAVVISAVRVSEKKKQRLPVSGGDIFSLVVPSLLVLLNILLVGQQIYRFKLGKRTTPTSSIFTIIVTAVLFILSGITISDKIKEIKNETTQS